MGSRRATINCTSASQPDIPAAGFRHKVRAGVARASAGARLAGPKPTRSLPAIAAIILQGCSADAAPAISLFGAYFPNWLVFGIFAVLFSSLSRVLFGLAGRAEFVPFPLFTHLSIGILVAGLLQILWLGR